jgi:nicotinate-nucleotide pyrophosphorylase (carboxylating)
MDQLDQQMVRSIVENALREDIGRADVTTDLTVGEHVMARGMIVGQQDGVLAGNPVAEFVFETVDPEITFEPRIDEGHRLSRGTVVAQVTGRARSCLTAERVALNFLQRLSGIATLTRQYVEKVAGTGVRILDTRKTTPGLRYLEKYAVRMGGGENHRFRLDELILLKDNHIEAAGGILNAIERIRTSGTRIKIEVETTNLDEVREALRAGADMIMLDNMSAEMMREAVKMAKGKARIEASGNMNLANVRQAAETGVDCISIGALTHSPPALDINLEIRKIESP